MAGAGCPMAVAPLFLLYDYSFRPPRQGPQDESLAAAYETPA